ncbi:MAG: hypothetical protein KDJ47_08790 [Hyphomicrobiaceae bacterium]|nr:hypothetical protein [Hyphomicrobiaceae bacterium]
MRRTTTGRVVAVHVARRARRLPSLGSWRRYVRGFSGDQSGAVAVIMAIMVALLLFVSAFAIDHSRFTNEAFQDSQALDAGLLAAATDFRKNQDDASAIARAKSVYIANRNDGAKTDIKSIKPDATNFEITGQTDFSWKATLMRAFGYDSKIMQSNAKVKYGRLSEVVLVIDNSSFAKNELEVFRTASIGLKTELMGLSGEGPVKMGVVPFAGSVNVGPQYDSAWWIDKDAKASFHRENYKKYQGSGNWTDETQTRLDLFRNIGEPWKGCVEARTDAYDGNDLPPDPEVPASLFVPMFAPDEPDMGRNKQAPDGQSYYNDYLPDYPDNPDGINCPKENCLQENDKGTCIKYEKINFTLEQYQQVSCKYAPGASYKPTVKYITDKKSPTTVDLTTGPNFNCTSVPLLPLTNDADRVEDKLKSMVASGGSNVAEGILWGYRVLSPQEPFTGGGPFDDEHDKYMIILARGANWIEAYKDNLNHSIYTPWGYGVNDRLNPQAHTQQSLTNAMDEKTHSACRIAAEKGVKVYTIGYKVTDPQMRSMLQYCAVHPKMFFEANSLDEVRDHMSTIASRITKLHLTQ